MSGKYYAVIMAADGQVLGQNEAVESVPECRQLVIEFVQELDNHAPTPEFYTIWEVEETEHEIFENVVECMPVDAIRKDSILHDQLTLGRRALSLLGLLHMFVINNEKSTDPIMKAKVEMAVGVLEKLEVE